MQQLIRSYHLDMLKASVGELTHPLPEHSDDPFSALSMSEAETASLFNDAFQILKTKMCVKMGRNINIKNENRQRT